jgi:hypothetical protein
LFEKIKANFFCILSVYLKIVDYFIIFKIDKKVDKGI